MPDADFTKDPDAVLDYGFDWSSWLQDGESITSSSWNVARSDGGSVDATDGLTVASSPAPSNSTTATTVWLEKGKTIVNYEVTNSIQTDASRSEDRTMIIRVKER